VLLGVCCTFLLITSTTSFLSGSLFTNVTELLLHIIDALHVSTYKYLTLNNVYVCVHSEGCFTPWPFHQNYRANLWMSTIVMWYAKAETSWFYVARYSWLIYCMKLRTYLILCTIYAVSVKCVSFVVLSLFLVPFFCLSFYNYASFLLQGTLVYELNSALALFFAFCTLCAEENFWTEEWRSHRRLENIT
jgi:hypothetical protein